MLFERYPDLKRLNAFFPEKTGSLIQHFPEEGEKPDIDYLEITKTVELIGFPGPPKLEIYVSFTANNKSGPVDLKLYDTAQLLDVPVRLGQLKHIVFGDRVDQFEFDTIFIFFEFIEGILWEMGFQTGSLACDIRRP